MQEAARDHLMAELLKVRRARDALSSALCEECKSYLAAENSGSHSRKISLVGIVANAVLKGGRV
jgi:predicted DNA-binding ribbon-helix-helix protein